MMKRIFINSFIVIFGANLFAQQAKIDSLENLLKTAKEDTNKVILLAYYADEFVFVQPSKSLFYIQEAYKLSEKISYRKGIAIAYYTMARINFFQERYSQVLNLKEKGLPIAISLNDTNLICNWYNLTANIYFEQKKYSQAVIYYTNALEIYEYLNIPIKIAIISTNLGNTYAVLKKYDTALVYQYKALRLQEKYGDEWGQTYPLVGIAQIYFEKSLYDSALFYFGKSEMFAKKLNIWRELSFSCKGLADTYSKLNNYKSAYQYYQIYSQCRDTIFNEQSTKQIAEMQTKYETEKKEQQIQIQQLEITNKEVEVKKQNFQKMAFAAGFGIVLILAFVIFRSLRITKTQKKIIEKQKVNVEKAKEIIEEKNKDITDSISYAQGIQSAIFPSEEMHRKLFPDSFILFKPRDIVSGDFYWVAEKNNLVFVAVADCTGHGVPGAFVSMVCATSLNRCVNEYGISEPGQILFKASELVEETLKDRRDGMDVSLCCFDFSNKIMYWSGANNPLCILQNSQFREIQGDRQPVGKFESRKNFTTHELSIGTGDMIYLYSDGYADQFGGPKGKKFKYSQFEKLLVSIQDKSMSEQREILNDAIDKWKGELEQIDDICIIGVRV